MGILKDEVKPWFKEPDPIKNDQPASWDLVLADLSTAKIHHPVQENTHKLLIADMKSRDEFGFKKYGTRLQPFNGRNQLKDAFEEFLDGTVYLRSALFENIKNALIVTPESENVKSGIVQLYMTALDLDLKLRYLMEYIEKEKNGKEQNSKDSCNNSIIDTRDSGNIEEFCDNKSNIIDTSR